MKDQRAQWRAGLVVSALATTAFVCGATFSWSDSNAATGTPSMGFQVIGAAGPSQHNSCFRLGGTAGQAAPGYSSNQSASVLAGFWAAAPTTGLDEIFFNGFERC
jgi:hypothetical protein